MTDYGRKSILISEAAVLSCKNGSLVIEQEGTVRTVPLEGIGLLLIESLQVRVSAALLQRLTEAGAQVVICNERHLPQAALIPYSGHFEKAGILRRQIEWKDILKRRVWKNIVRAKLDAQVGLLRKCDLPAADNLERIRHAIRLGDPSNREGQAAKAYFKAMFGADFTRDMPCATNAALNYGYAILLSITAKAVVATGHDLNLGIHHNNAENPYNLACDLMEPFRPCVDEIVREHMGEPLEKALKATLLKSFYRPVFYDNIETQLYTAIGMFVEDVLKVMSEKTKEWKELDLFAQRRSYGGSL